MDLNFGINGSISVQAARPILVPSTTPIGLAGYSEVGHGLHKFNNAEAALADLDDSVVDGELVNALKGIALQGVSCPLLVCLSNGDQLLDTLDLYKNAEGLTGIPMKGGVLAAPGVSTNLQVGAKLDAIAGATWSTALMKQV